MPSGNSAGTAREAQAYPKGDPSRSDQRRAQVASRSGSPANHSDPPGTPCSQVKPSGTRSTPLTES